MGLLGIFEVLTAPHRYVPETRKPVQGILSFLDTTSIGSLLLTCTTLALDIGYSRVLMQESHAGYIAVSNMIRRLVHVGPIEYARPECGCGVCRVCDYTDSHTESHYGELEVEAEGDFEGNGDQFADGESVSVFSEEEHDHDHASEPHLAHFVGCNRCGCSQRMDEIGDRVCWCDACTDGCVYVKDHCFNCDCLEEYDAYSGDRVCFHESCRQSGCVHKHFTRVKCGKEFTKP